MMYKRFWSLFPVFLLMNIPVQVLASVGAVKSGLDAGDLAKHLADLGVYGSTRAVIVTNKGDAGLRLWCASADDKMEKWLNPGEFFSFSFRPRVTGGYTLFWCTANYKEFWARWDVFGWHAYYGFDNRNDQAYVYEIRDDGIYYRGKKIRGLASGQNRYILWESYDNDKNPFGTSLTGYVDGGVCNNIPGFMERKTSDVTVCDGRCVILFSELHCSGDTSRLQAKGGCTNFWLGHFNDRAKSVKGC